MHAYIYTHTHIYIHTHIHTHTYTHTHIWASQVVVVVKNPPANAGNIRDDSLICKSEDSLGEEMVTHSSILARRIPWTEEPGGL